MKILILITSLLICNLIYANKPVSIKQTYEFENGKKDIFILQLLDNSRYNFTRYLGKTVCHDSGFYQIKGHAIEFRTTINSTWANYFLKNKYYIDSKGIYVSRLNALLNKNIQYRLSEPTNNLTDWMYNPVTKTTITKTSYDFDKAKKTSVYRPITAEKLQKIEIAELAKLQLEKDKTDLNSKSLYVEKNFSALINKLIPEYNYLVKMAYCGPGCYKELGSGGATFNRNDAKGNTWCGDSSEYYILNNWGLIIHESTHKMNEEVINYSPVKNSDGSIKSTVDFVSQKYLIESDKFIKVDVNEYFKSEEMLSIIPMNLQPKVKKKNTFTIGGDPDPIDRFSTYISKGAYTSSNEYGIYGLLDEFSAYYHGSNASLKAAQNKVSLSNNNLHFFLDGFRKQYTAYYEFNLFIAWYLHYAKLYRKDVYTSLMENNNLRIAYTLLDKQFSKCISDYFKIKLPEDYKSIYEYLETSYVPKLKGYLATEQSYLDEFKLDSKANYAE